MLWGETRIEALAMSLPFLPLFAKQYRPIRRPRPCWTVGDLVVEISVQFGEDCVLRTSGYTGMQVARLRGGLQDSPSEVISQ
jgi:hypothetical protein